MKTVEIQCCVSGCGHSPFPMAEQFYDRAKRTHEYWHCPAGHSQHFVGETDEQRTHREVVESLKREIKIYEDAYVDQRAMARTCPWPTCREYVYSSRDSMYEHMRRIHGMPTLALVEAAS